MEMAQPRSARSVATFNSAKSPFVFKGATLPAYDKSFHMWRTEVRQLREFSVVEVEVLRGTLLEPELVVLRGVLEEVGGVLEHVLVTRVGVVVGLAGGGVALGVLEVVFDRRRGRGRRGLDRLVFARRFERLVELVGEALVAPEVLVLFVLEGGLLLGGRLGAGGV